MKAVIYARYSCERQTEQSIEGQLHECNEYARKNDITIVNTYIDRATSGKSDNRLQFQQMIKDSDKQAFEAVIVYKMDRFSRNRYDSAVYKARLKKNGVRVLYAKESIPDGPEGIILESLLEGMAEYYSAELAQKVKRGLHENALKCRTTGGIVPLGYKITEDKKYAIDEEKARIVQRIFQQYADGARVCDICKELNDLGIRSARGAEFNKNSLRVMLKNEKYIGIYKCKDVRIEGGIPAVIDKELFDRVQERIEENKAAPARQKSNAVDYLLSGKMYCGNCGGGMVGVSGKGKLGEKYYYYACSTKNRLKSCDKKNVRKEWIESVVVDETIKNVLNPEKIDYIAKRCVEIQNREMKADCELDMLNKQLADTKKSIKNIMAAIEEGIITKNTKERLSELEEAQERIEYEISTHKLRQPQLTEKQIKYLLDQYCRESDEYDEQYNRDVINCFVSTVHLYEDKICITYNLTNQDQSTLQSTLEIVNNPAKADEYSILRGLYKGSNGGR